MDEGKVKGFVPGEDLKWIWNGKREIWFMPLLLHNHHIGSFNCQVAAHGTHGNANIGHCN
jgi:hypothetical protein